MNQNLIATFVENKNATVPQNNGIQKEKKYQQVATNSKDNNLW